MKLSIVFAILALSHDVSASSANGEMKNKEAYKPQHLFPSNTNSKNAYANNHLHTPDTFTNKILTRSKLLRRRASSSNDDIYDGDDYYEYNSTQFDLSKFSVKFHSCSSISSFDFDKFEHNDDTKDNEVFPYTTTQVVNYRLCPTDTCQDDSWKGCKNVYGNYVITLEDYFEAQEEDEEYLKESFEKKCDYCEECEYFYKKYNEQCDHYDICSDYDEEACKNYDKNTSKSSTEVDYSKYLDCTKVDIKEDKEDKENKNDKEGKESKENKNDKEDNEDEEQEQDDYFEEDEWVKAGRVYLKVYCDGSLKVGIFSDDKCSQYIGDQVSIETLTDLPIYEDDLKSEFKKQGCVSCNNKVKATSHIDHSQLWKVCISILIAFFFPPSIMVLKIRVSLKIMAIEMLLICAQTCMMTRRNVTTNFL